ncbi:CBO0543 family protein [Paenibacillus alkalitolerans]|uniref:CBO0543 family protein n=1 Tax=Paenibacillus alkalitolerans TaxID=2799335 RepID=UPI0018F420BF|nr:CBO0543 family protein [Paenibacillus alkalitolerans]
MKMESMILVSVWITAFSLFFFIPRKKFRLAQTALLFKQMLTWIIGLVVVELGWIEYPVREFASVIRSSFTFEYLAYPIICGLFNARYPENRSLLFKLFYYSSYCTVITVVELLIEINTNLVNYIHWSWYWTWITLFITFFMSRKFSKWFFSISVPKGEIT